MVTIIDSDNLINRVYYIHQNLKAQDGTPTGALHGFLTSVHWMLKKQQKGDHLIFVWDTSSARKKTIYPDYKGNRPEKPGILFDQKPMVQQMISLLDLQQVKIQGEEADDIISSLVFKCRRLGHKVTIFSRDHDFEQLINKSVKVLCPDKQYVLKDTDWVLEHRGIHPNLLGDMMVLRGDQSDNVPGVEGVGTKKAVSLINLNGGLDGLLNNLSDAKIHNRNGEITKISSKLAERIQTAREQIEINKDLVVLDDRLKFNFQLKRKWKPAWSEFFMMLQRYECFSLINKFKEFDHTETPFIL